MTEPITDLLCTECGILACDHRYSESSKSVVDPATFNGLNPVYWSQYFQSQVSVLLDPVSGALWSYESGVWVESRSIIQDHLPLMMGKNYRRGDVAHIGDRITAELKRDREHIRPDQPDTRYVSLPSGLFELATGEVVTHTPSILTVYKLEVEPKFDAPTPEFDRFLSSVLHVGDTDRMLDILAYLLIPGNPRQKAVLLTGSGRNGKGILMSIIKDIIGKPSIATVALNKISTRFAAAELYGRPLNMVGDIDGDHITLTGNFKQITGGDMVHMDVKNAQAFSANVWAVPVFSANKIPTSADTSHGYLRRWEVVEFPNQFDGSDTSLEDRLSAELPAIAGKLLTHAVGNLYQIRESEPGKAAHDTFARKSDPVREWLAETELTGHVKAADVYADYRAWIDDGNGKTPLTKRSFNDRIRAVLGKETSINGARGWRFKTAPSEPQTAPYGVNSAPKLHPNSTSRNAVTSTNGVEGAESAVSRGIRSWGMEGSEPASGASVDPFSPEAPEARIPTYPDPFAD